MVLWGVSSLLIFGFYFYVKVLSMVLFEIVLNLAILLAFVFMLLPFLFEIFLDFVPFVGLSVALLFFIFVFVK